MLRFALDQPHPTAIRYPKANLERIERAAVPIELGKSEVLEWGGDGAIVAFGSLLPTCVQAARKLRQETGLDIGVINARFAKPLDQETLFRAIEELPFVVTVEEGALAGGFGSALLEAASAAGLDTRGIVRLGLPDRFIEHGERAELLKDLGLDLEGVYTKLRELAETANQRTPRVWPTGQTA
jgi:1-deoxy-D-xylulose-5-phosphate synthase